MDDKIKQAIRKAEHAKTLLENPVLTGAWEQVEGDLHKMWANSKSDDTDGREALYRELHGLKSVRARLEQTINAGKLAEKELEHQKNGN